MANKRDYYEILGLKKSASDAEIKRAYRKLAHQYHPDKGGGDEAKFKEVNEAYQVLSDPKKRQAYDQFGHAGPFGAGQGAGAGGFDWSQYAGQGFQGFDFSDLSGFGDIFETFFGGGGATRQKERRGVDLEMVLTIDFKDSVYGTTKDLSINKYNVCDRCKGNGAEPGSGTKTCPTCKGRGTVEIAQRTILGSFVRRETCPDCLGSGKIPEKICSKCRGEGRVKSQERIKVKIPAGIQSGQSIRLAGQGEAAPKGGKSGDLYIRIIVNPSRDFIREGHNILNTVEISFPEAALGTIAEIPTVDGPVKLKIPAGTQSGKVFKIPGKGVGYSDSSHRGDHLVTVHVKTPEKLTKKQKELLEEFQKDEGKRGWF
ncbi:MAG: molecular chaperone DnaJ [Patescibacteria group bacterium]|nr:molecular chaperone DnaJ [Patescibacteria group bacterium]